MKHVVHKVPNTSFASMALAVILTGFVASTYGFGVYLFANLVVDMRRDMVFDYTIVGLITAGGQVGFLSFSFLTSYLSRYYPGWQISLTATSMSALSLIGLSISHSVGVSAVLLMLLGGCSAAAYIPLAEIVAKQFPANMQARVMGLISSGTSYGVFINGLLVGFLMGIGGWRVIWLSAGVMTLLLCVCAFFYLRHTAHAPLTQSNASSRHNELGHEPWVTRPLCLVWAVAFLNGLALLPFQTYLAPFMREELGISVTETGMVWSTIGAVGMVSGFLIGWVADRIGSRTTLILCFGSACLSSVVVVLWHHIAFFYLAGFLFALAFYPIFGLVPTYIGQIVPVGRLTQAFGIANVLIGLGGVCGNFIGGLLKDVLASFIPVYWVVALILLVQMMLTAALPKSGRLRQNGHG